MKIATPPPGKHAGQEIKQKTKQATKEAKPWIRPLGRFGYLAKGVVYMLIGIMAAQTAFGLGGKLTDSKGVFQTIASKPFGSVMLALVAVGLLGYAIWKIAQGFADTERKGSGLKGWSVRLAFIAAGIAHIGISFSAFGTLMNAADSGNSEKGWSAMLLAQPFGQWLVGIAGSIALGFGIYQIYKAIKNKFLEYFEQAAMNPSSYHWAKRVGKIGITAHGIVFGVIGIFLIRTALHANPDEARGLDGALVEIAKQPFGPWMLGAVALGLIAYGIYLLTLARYRQMNVT
ncbi:DUF1206 domain-containing protein [Aneurinibacillus sp. REN35]|uniref:DUF1206 domain-containing protein n=1 Tax=Aneurinibacillus sp. REN35 TaxID=3237286 RepID=UPI003527649F